MVPGLGSSRGESTTSKIGFYPGNMQERLISCTIKFIICDWTCNVNIVNFVKIYA